MGKKFKENGCEFLNEDDCRDLLEEHGIDLEEEEAEEFGE